MRFFCVRLRSAYERFWKTKRKSSASPRLAIKPPGLLKSRPPFKKSSWIALKIFRRKGVGRKKTSQWRLLRTNFVKWTFCVKLFAFSFAFTPLYRGKPSKSWSTFWNTEIWLSKTSTKNFRKTSKLSLLIDFRTKMRGFFKFRFSKSVICATHIRKIFVSLFEIGLPVCRCAAQNRRQKSIFWRRNKQFFWLLYYASLLKNFK